MNKEYHEFLKAMSNDILLENLKVVDKARDLRRGRNNAKLVLRNTWGHEHNNELSDFIQDRTFLDQIRERFSRRISFVNVKHTSWPYAFSFRPSQTCVLLWFREEVPVDCRVRRRSRIREVGARVLRPDGFRASGFKQYHFPLTLFRKTICHNTASGSSTNDDKIYCLRIKMSFTVYILTPYQFRQCFSADITP